MAKYGPIERMAARALDSFPGIRRTAKAAYQRFNYQLFHEQGFQCKLHFAAQIAPVEPPAPGVAATFFGYYDKSPWHPHEGWLLFHTIRNDGTVGICATRSPSKGFVDLGHSHTWNHQQGAMLQWVSSRDEPTVIYNDLVDGGFGARLRSVTGGEAAAISWPVQAVHPNKSLALSLNYARLARLRPEYGYTQRVPNANSRASLKNDGIWRVDLESNTGELIVRIEDLLDIMPIPAAEADNHKVNHAMYSPAGSRFVFLHRWFGRRGKRSRLFVAHADGTHLRVLLDEGMISHYSWRDERTLLAYARGPLGDGYYLVNVESGCIEPYNAELGQQGDGHPSFSPNGEWVLTDTYPDRARQRRLLLHHSKTGRLLEVGRFFAPWKFDGPVRCDLHPRWSPDGQSVSIDSVHEGHRRMYVIDVSKLVLGSA